ncbi:MAG: NADH-quinone oxidoreductase subunit NuoN [Devosia sp.]
MASDLQSLSALGPVLPEIMLALAALILLLVGAVFLKREHSVALTGVAIAVLLVLAVWVATQNNTGVLFNGGFINDGFARFMKVLVLSGSAFALLISLSSAKENGIAKFEYAVLVMLATVGMMMMVSANDLMTLYVGLELQSLALYVLAAMNRTNTKATEAGVKYFVLGALSSGMLLYGASLVYGFTGQTQLDQIAQAISMGPRSIGLVFGLVFLLAGVAFKIAAVPFHMWTPDVYEGAPTPVTAFFATAPKVAAMALFIRIVTVSFAPVVHDWQQIVIFLSIASMVLASFAAIGQTNLKRFIAYSSIGHMGFALVGLSAGTANGVEGVTIYMAIYMVMTIGFFACLLALRTENGPIENISDLAGLGQTRPFTAAIMAVMMFSYVGLPPLGGFFAKWQVFLAAIEAHLFALAVIGMLASAVSAFYYLRVVKTMYFDEPKLKFAGVPGELNFTMALSGFLIVTYYLTVGSPLSGLAHAAAGSLF